MRFFFSLSSEELSLDCDTDCENCSTKYIALIIIFRISLLVFSFVFERLNLVLQ